jgi:hypothetical protein
MSLDLLHYKARQREQRARFETVFSVALALLLCIVFGWTCVRTQDTIPRAGWGLLSLWSGYFGWQVYHWIRPRRLAPDATVGTSLAFYRSELERRRDWGRHEARRAGLLFCLAGVAMVLAPPVLRSPDALRELAKAAPFLALLSIWAVAFLFQRRSCQQKLTREIEELSAFERENRP